MEQTNQSFSFDIVHQEEYSRGQLLLRSFFGFIYIVIPHAFVLLFMSLAAGVLRFIAWWAILFTGKHPKGFFDFQVGLLIWGVRLNSRMLNLADGYPAFGTENRDPAIQVNIPYPEKLNIGTHLLKSFFGIFYVFIPHGFCLFFRMIATQFITLAAWFVILFTGKYPKGMFDFVVGTLRWATRISVYMGYLSDEYPKFSGKP
ncbi:MAG: DUF4389 domain-containing protein [Bacteroidia bacterium]